MAELFQLRADHQLTVGFVSMQSIVVLVIAFCRIEIHNGGDFSHDGGIENLLFGQQVNDLLCGDFLRFIMIENDGPVLSPDIVSLPVERGWVVAAEEGPEEGFERGFLRIERDADDFGMSSFSGADILVSRVLNMSS